jgi:excisionase family DNA binding protein
MKWHRTFGQISLEPEHSQPRGSNGGVNKKPTPSPSFFTERTLAAFLAVSDRTVRNWIRRGELVSYKLGASRRIDPADVETFLARRREEVP